MPEPGARSTSAITLAVSILLTLLMAAPVLRAPSERIFGNEINGRHHDPYTAMRQFAGAPVPPPYFQPATDVPGRLLGRLLHPVAAYNFVVLATFPLAAVFACLLAFEITGARGLSVAAGLAFAFSPFHLAQAADHPHIAQVQWIALFLLALWLCVHGFAVWRGLLLAAATALVALSNFYGALIAAAVTPFAVILFWFAPSRNGPPRRIRDLAATVTVLAVLAAVGLALVWRAVPSVFTHPERYAVHPIEPPLYSARWWSYLVPPVDHALLGGFADRLLRQNRITYGRLEHQVYIGFGVLLLAAVALWRPGRAGTPILRAAPWIAAVGLVAFAWSLTPTLRIAGLEIPGPSAFLHALLPMFRAYARFAVVVQLAAVLVAALGAARLLETRTRAANAAVCALAALVVFEYAPVPWRWRDVLPTTAHRWMVQNAPHASVFDCARMTLGERHTAWLSGLRLQHRGSTLDDCADPDVAMRLRLAGFTHLLARQDGTLRWLLERGRPGLSLIYQGEDSAVFAVNAKTADLYVGALSGLHDREFASNRTWRWSAGDAVLRIVNAGVTPREATLRIQLQSAGGPRRVTVSLDGEHIADLDLTTSRAVWPIGPMTVRPGTSVLRLRSAEPPVTPAARGDHPRDRRWLAFAIGEWEWKTD